MKRRTVLTVTAVFVVFAGCEAGSSFRDKSRADQLMKMAGEEAAQIQQSRQRLAMLLQIAQEQVHRGYHRGARNTLALAKQTILDDAADLDVHIRLAGLVAVSELSREVNDRAGALSACDEAVKLLRAVEPVTERCQYVRDMARELRALRGKSAAAELLRDSGPWAAQIKPEKARREAQTAIARDLFLYDDYEGGRQVLRQDPDAAWRTNILLTLARKADPPLGKDFGQRLGKQYFIQRGMMQK